MLQKIFAVLFLTLPLSAIAQVAPATTGGGWSLSAGAEYSNFLPDWGPQRLQGIAAFFDVDHIVLRNLGVEGEARWLRFNPPQGETEDNYLIGPRYRIWRYHGLSLYAKFLLGGGWITYYPSSVGSGSYFAYAPGGTAEYQLSRRWIVRGDYEYQFWPAAPGIVFTYPNPSNGLTPNGFSVGVAYKIF